MRTEAASLATRPIFLPCASMVYFMVLDKFDEGHGTAVMIAVRELHDAGVASFAILVLRGDSVEKFFDLGLSLKPRNKEAA